MQGMDGMKLVAGKPPLFKPEAHTHCPGCHYGIILRLLLETLVEMGLDGKAIGHSSGGCGALWAHNWLDLDMYHLCHGPGIAGSAAIKRAEPDAFVFTVVGDGEIGAIGLGYFMASMIRGDKTTTIFLNNGCYGMTGGQSAATTLTGTRTTTAPLGRRPETEGYPFHATEIAAQMQGVAYSARVSVHTPANFQRAKKALRTAFRKQIDGVGFGIVEFLSACPPNWHLTPVESIKRLESEVLREYPLGEFKNVDKL